MDKYDYELILNKIKKLERLSKKIVFEEEYLKFTKPSIIEIQKRKTWKDRKNNLLLEKNNINNELLIAYSKLEKLFQIKTLK